MHLVGSLERVGLEPDKGLESLSRLERGRKGSETW